MFHETSNRNTEETTGRDGSCAANRFNNNIDTRYLHVYTKSFWGLWVCRCLCLYTTQRNEQVSGSGGLGKESSLVGWSDVNIIVFKRIVTGALYVVVMNKKKHGRRLQ